MGGLWPAEGARQRASYGESDSETEGYYLLSTAEVRAVDRKIKQRDRGYVSNFTE